jgi:2-polyprenyl-6-methoxyphenol hydroxylase-like FAD-dependent oxidoreductase
VHVLIAGGGIGGLCLAQGLRRYGIGATVHERDPSPDARGQGYRISLKRDGVDALRECLPPELFELCAATAIRAATRMIFMDTQLRPRFSKPIPESTDGFGVNRRTLREILLIGLEDVHFGRTLTSYEETAAGVTAHFEDGSTASGDLLVGADGTGSAVRAQLLPDAVIDELGASIYGRTPMPTGPWLPDELTDSFNRVIGDPAAFSVATCRARHRPSEAAARLAPGAVLTDIPDYLQWMVSPFPGGSHHGTADATTLHAIAAETVTGWHPGVERIIAEADVAATFPVVLTSARRVDGWESAAVTLLGDAIHTMSPGRGEGANTALRDAALLARTLAGVAPLPVAKRRYEAEMLYYGFEAVELSLSHPFGPARRP